MFNVGTAELLVILLVALLVLGPTRLPEAARQLGRALAELRRLSSGFQAEMRDALREPVEGMPRSGASGPPSKATTGDGALSRPSSSGTTATEVADEGAAAPAAGSDTAGSPPDRETGSNGNAPA